MKPLSILVLLLIAGSPIYSQSNSGNSVKYTSKTYTYKTIDTLQIKADFIQKENSLFSPVIIWIHGGGLIFGSRTDIPGEQLNLYLNAGYSIVSIDYRLAPETKLPDIVSDVVDAVKWVQRNGSNLLKVDSNNIFLVGHSGGAYLALTAGYILKNPPKAIISFYGYGAINSDWYTKPSEFYLKRPLVSDQELEKLVHRSPITHASVEDRFNIYLYTRQKGNWPTIVCGHNPATQNKWFRSFNPINNIQLNYPPVLLIHGKKDMDVPFAESIQLKKKFDSRKIKSKLIQLENSGHVFDLFEGGLANPSISSVFAEVIEFLNNYRKAQENLPTANTSLSQ